MERKLFLSETKALKNGDVEAYVSTEGIDRVGDVILTSGWQLDNYRKSGAPVLFSHDYNTPPIGTAVEIEVQGKGLWSRTRFHEKTQLSRDLAILAREYVMRSWSVGFNPLEKPEQRKDDRGGFAGYIFTKQELLEYSLVPVPANPEAVSKALFMAEKGRISDETARILTRSRSSSYSDSDEDELQEVVEHFLRRAKAFSDDLSPRDARVRQRQHGGSRYR